MRKTVLISLCLVAAIVLSSCGRMDSDNPVTINLDGTTKMRLAMQVSPDLGIHSGEVTISRGDMAHSKPLEFDNGFASVLFSDLQPGTWLIEVALRDVDGTVIYAGSGEAGVIAGQTTTATIVVGELLGDLEVIIELDLDEVDGLIAYYPFNGSAMDQSGNGNDGEVFGATLIDDRFGDSSKAYYFDGTGNTFIDVGMDLKIPLPITVAAWVKPDSSNPGIVFRNDNVDGMAYYHGVSVFVHDGRLAGWVGSGYAGPSSVRDKYTLEAPVSVDEWSHVVVVFNDFDDMQLYVNGVEYEGEMGGTGTGMTYSGSGHGYIGSGTFLNPGYTDFSGTMDEVMFFDRPLTAEEIATLYE